MITLAMRMARHRLTSLIAVACAVLGGAALVTATGVLAESGLRSHAPTGRLAGADIVVSGKQSVDASADFAAALPERHRLSTSLAADLQDVPGVHRSVGDITFPAALLDTDGRIVDTTDLRASAAHGWSSTHLLGEHRTDGTPPSADHQVALGSRAASSAQVTVGDLVGVAAAGRPPQNYRVSAIIDGAGDDLFFSDRTATRLAALDGRSVTRSIDLIGLRVDRGSTEQIASVIRREVRGSGLVVSTGAVRGDAIAPDVAAARSTLLLVAGSLAGIVMMLVGFVVAGAVAVSVAGQRRSLALIRSVGGTPRQVRHLVAGEATAIALLAMAPGLALGYLLAGQLGRLLRAVDILPASLPLTFSPLPAAAAVVSMVCVVQLSARAASWRTSRLAPTRAVVESSSAARSGSTIRARVGVLTILAAVTLSGAPLIVTSEISAAMTSTAGIVASIGLAIAGPALLRRAGDAIAARVPRRASATTWLAIANMRVFATRFAGVITASTMLIVFTLTYALSQTTLLQATADSEHAGTSAQHRITADQLGGVPRDVVDQVRDLSGVRDAAPVSRTSVVWPHRVLGELEITAEPAMILTPQAPGVLDLDVRHGSLEALEGDTVAVGRDIADSRDAAVGRSVDLTLGDGSEVRARVVAVYDRTLGFGSIVLSRDLAEGHTTSGLDQSVLVRVDDTPNAARALESFTASRPGLSIGSTRDDTGQSLASPTLWLNIATIAVLLGYLSLTIANRIVATTAQRGGELSALRLAGATRRQILAITRREALIAGAMSSIAGFAVAALPLAFLGIGFLGRPWPAGPIWLMPATALFIVVLTSASVELPARSLLRSSPLTSRS